MRGITDSVKHLLIINVLMFIGTLTIQNGVFYEWFALYFPQNDLFKPWQVLTHMFMHGNIMHIAFNMFALWMFGTAVEQVLGGKKFLFVYFSAGFGAVLLTFLVYYIQIFPYLNEVSSLGLPKDLVREIVNLDILQRDLSNGQSMYTSDLLQEKMIPLFAQYNQSLSNIDSEAIKALFNLNVKSQGSMVGASGAIMGILVAFGMLFPESKLMLIFLPIPIKAKYFIPGIIALDLFSAISGRAIFSPDNTAFVAHIGGALTGFIIMWFWRKNQFDKHRWN